MTEKTILVDCFMGATCDRFLLEDILKNISKRLENLDSYQKEYDFIISLITTSTMPEKEVEETKELVFTLMTEVMLAYSYLGMIKGEQQIDYTGTIATNENSLLRFIKKEIASSCKVKPLISPVVYKARLNEYIII